MLAPNEPRACRPAPIRSRRCWLLQSLCGLILHATSGMALRYIEGPENDLSAALQKLLDRCSGPSPLLIHEGNGQRYLAVAEAATDSRTTTLGLFCDDISVVGIDSSNAGEPSEAENLDATVAAESVKSTSDRNSYSCITLTRCRPNA